MPRIKLSGKIRDEIYAKAINNLPNGGAYIANIISSNPRNQPCSAKKAYEKTCAFMKHSLKPKEQEQMLHMAARNLLINKYGYNAGILDCCKFQIRSNELVLKGDGRFKSLVKNASNMSQNLIDKLDQKISDIPKIKAEKDAVLMQLDRHQQWLHDREEILSKARKIFGMNDQQIREFAQSLPDHRANLSGMVIRDMDLSGYDLTGIICKGATIENCTLGNISGADLTRSTISNTRFVGTDMSYTRLDNTRIDHVRIENYSNMVGANFSGSKQQSASFINCNFEGAILSGEMSRDLQTISSEQEHSSQEHDSVQAKEQSVVQSDIEIESPAMAM